MMSHDPKRPAERGNRSSRTKGPSLSNKPEKPPKIDKRANRTRGALARAMIELGGTQGVDAVKAGDLARQAGVSRSTF